MSIYADGSFESYICTECKEEYDDFRDMIRCYKNCQKQENKVKQELMGECLAYIKFGQEIHPTHVEDMVKKAFKAGYEEAMQYQEFYKLAEEENQDHLLTISDLEFQISRLRLQIRRGIT